MKCDLERLNTALSYNNVKAGALDLLICFFLVSFVATGRQIVPLSLLHVGGEIFHTAQSVTSADMSIYWHESNQNAACTDSSYSVPFFFFSLHHHDRK